MKTIKLDNLIGMPIIEAKTWLENMGYTYEVKELSKPRMKASEMLVVKYKKVDDKKLLLTIGEFIIDI